MSAVFSRTTKGCNGRVFLRYYLRPRVRFWRSSGLANHCGHTSIDIKISTYKAFCVWKTGEQTISDFARRYVFRKMYSSARTSLLDFQLSSCFTLEAKKDAHTARQMVMGTCHFPKWSLICVHNIVYRVTYGKWLIISSVYMTCFICERRSSRTDR